MKEKTLYQQFEELTIEVRKIALDVSKLKDIFLPCEGKKEKILLENEEPWITMKEFALDMQKESFEADVVLICNPFPWTSYITKHPAFFEGAFMKISEIHGRTKYLIKKEKFLLCMSNFTGQMTQQRTAFQKIVEWRKNKQEGHC